MHTSPTHKYLIVVVGPTAVGKTALCIHLAQQLCTEVVSADARQLYQGMAIGTAQPSPESMQGIPHHFLNCLPITAPYSAGMFERNALKTLDRLFDRYDQVLLTGGSGLYVKAVCEGFDAMPQVDNKIRALLNEQFKKEGITGLAQALRQQDPAYYNVVDRYNPRRIMRALEVCIAIGKPYSLLRKHCLKVRPFVSIKIGLMRDRQLLAQRINQRVDQMIEQGLLQEATALYAYKAYNALQTVGYQELFGYLEGKYSQQEAIERIKRNTRRYAKRQLTWFRRDKAIRWFHPDDFTGIINYVKARMTN